MKLAFAVAVMLTLSIPLSAQIEVSKLGEMVGWTITADTNIQGEFEGPDYDKVVKLDNGWIIEFEDYDYFYEYHPEIVIFATQFKGVTLYKAVIDGGDDVYDIRRVR
jgi:hypothetical protein